MPRRSSRFAASVVDPPARRADRGALRDREPSAGFAGPVLVLIVGGVSLTLALLLLWGLGQREAGGTDPDPPAVAQTAASPEPTDPAAPVTPSPTGEDDDDGAAVTEAIARLDAMVQASDCANQYADAQLLHEYASAAGAGGSWPDLVSARRPAVTIDALAERCGSAYAERLARYVIDDPRSDAVLVYTLQDHFAELPQHHPAPADALDADAVRTVDGTIGCTLTADGVGCVVHEHDFADPPACLEGATGPFSIALFATDVYPCAGTVTGGAVVLHEAESTAVGDYACTAGPAEVRCWHTVSGTSFTLTPQAVLHE